LVEVTLSGGSTVVLEGAECPALRRLLAACHLLEVESHRAGCVTDVRAAEAWVLIGAQQLSARVRDLRASGFKAWLCVLETASLKSEGEANLLDAGADCYWSEPVDPLTVAARMRALLRHSSGAYTENGVSQASLLESERVLLVGGNTYVLSPREIGLLKYLRARAGTWVTRHQLLRDLFGAQTGHDPSIVRTHLANIKKKLRGDHWVLRTDRTAGVMFVACGVESPGAESAPALETETLGVGQDCSGFERRRSDLGFSARADRNERRKT
jgi:DNA-binding response OmpR family regulator